MSSNELEKYVPSGCMTYSKGNDQYPSNCPSLFTHGKGPYLFDNDDKYLDYGMGLRSVILGYSEESVNKYAIEQLLKGNNLSRPSHLELEAAKVFTEITGFDMVKFAKNGSNVTTAATKLARAYTGKKYILVCNQPFFSFDDWFIGTTLPNHGIPSDHYKYTIKFDYNDYDKLHEIFNNNDDIAGLIMEPVNIIEPTNDFLKKVRKLCDDHNVVLIFDEMISGFRWSIPSAGNYFNVVPDLATFGKAIGNGFSISALVGKRKIMDPATSPFKLFLLSSTHGAEMCSLGALIATMNFYKNNDVIGHIWNYGNKLIDEINKISAELNLSEYFVVKGYPCSPYYLTYDINKNISLEYKTLFMQEMIKNKVIMNYISISFAHGNDELLITLDAVKKSLEIYKKALNEGIEKYLIGPVIKPVFRKYE